MATTNDDLKKQADELYERYGKPLEAEHWGEYLAISPKGEIILGFSPLEAAQKATEAFGRGIFLFKVGEIAVYKWR